MRSSRPRTVAVVAAVLLLGIAMVGCGRDRQKATSTAPSATYVATSSAGFVGSPAPTGSGPTAKSTAAGAPSVPTPDPVASELDQINQLINDINDSVDSSDGGE